MEWLVLAGFGIMWLAFLLPGGGQRRSAADSVDDFERGMELLAYSEIHGTTGRWIVTPRKGARFVGTQERHRSRARDRRRRVFVVLLEAIGLTGLIGAVPPLRPVWSVTLLLAIVLLLYVWLLLSMKARAAGPSHHERVRAARPPSAVSVPARAPTRARHVAEGPMAWARPTFDGLAGSTEGDQVHVVVKPASAGA